MIDTSRRGRADARRHRGVDRGVRRAGGHRDLEHQARSDLAASRARIVAATDEERRRVVRDLHDGAQQRLVHTIMTLKLARRAIDRGDPSARARWTRHSITPSRATGELRELAHGILPSVLTRGGLHAASTHSRRACRCRSRWTCRPRGCRHRRGDRLFRRRRGAHQRRKARARQPGRVTRAVATGTSTAGGRRRRRGRQIRRAAGWSGSKDRVAVLDGRLRVESPERRRNARSTPRFRFRARHPRSISVELAERTSGHYLARAARPSRAPRSSGREAERRPGGVGFGACGARGREVAPGHGGTRPSRGCRRRDA